MQEERQRAHEKRIGEAMQQHVARLGEAMDRRLAAQDARHQEHVRLQEERHRAHATRIGETMQQHVACLGAAMDRRLADQDGRHREHVRLHEGRQRAHEDRIGATLDRLGDAMRQHELQTATLMAALASTPQCDCIHTRARARASSHLYAHTGSTTKRHCYLVDKSSRLLANVLLRPALRFQQLPLPRILRLSGVGAQQVLLTTARRHGEFNVTLAIRDGRALQR